jgi:hypothetical protein
MVSFSGIVKSGISGAFIAAGYAATAHPVTLVALAALPWAAHRLSQCCSRQREPAAPAAVQGLHRLDFEEMLLDEAIASIRRSQNDAAQAYVCPYVNAPYALHGLSTELAEIPEFLLYEKKDGTKCNLVRYLTTLLYQNEAPGPKSKDFLGKVVNTNELREMSEKLGITLEAYKGIWQKAHEQSLIDDQYDESTLRRTMFCQIVENMNLFEQFSES